MTKKERAEADHRRAAHHAKWRAAHAARAGWTDDDHDSEAARLEAEIQAMVESGAVTICPPDAGLTNRGIGSPEVGDLMGRWVITPTQ